MLNCPYPKPLVPSAATHTPSSSPAPSWAPGPLGNVGGSSGENPGWGPVVGGWLLGNVTVTALAGRLSTLRPPGHHLPKPGAAAPLACSACPQPLLHRSVLAPGSRPFPSISLLSSLPYLQCCLFGKVICGEMAHYSVER